MRLEINYRKKTVKNTNKWKLNSTPLNNQEITEKTKEKIKKYIEANDNENMKTQNLWDTAKAVLRGKFIAIQSHLKKQEKSQINNLTLHLKQLDKEEQREPKVSRRKEIIKITVEINEIETKKTIAKINKTKSCFFLKKLLFIFLAALGLHCCTWAFSSCSKRELLSVAVHRPLIEVASLVAEHGL